VGFKLGGVPGAVVAVVACMLPAFFIIMLLSYLLNKFSHLAVVDGIMSGIRPAVTGLIASAALAILFLAFFQTKVLRDIRSVDVIAVVIAAGSFVLARWKKINPVLIILGAGVVGLGLYYLEKIIMTGL